MSAPETGGTRPRAACPHCGKPVIEAFRPFCSERCQNLDLHRWLTGAYAIPVIEDDETADTLNRPDAD
ncbi:MAG: DNA gyrase inhibitor YacG [Rhizobiaceae bacterium]|jgi:hypothetical protein|nr:DNA gyrase inhibitor YacG [Rhizobiaceae bacterium]